jgi:hypothetical protein
MALRSLSILAILALGACESVMTTSGPPIAGESRGTAAAPITQRVDQQPHSAPTSAGAPSISGGNTSGMPQVERTTPGTGTLGGGTPMNRAPGSQGGGRGS